METRILQDYDTIQTALASGQEELIPVDVVYALLDGANPIRVWREFRGIPRQALADQAGISTAYPSQLENGRRTGSLAVLTSIARVLQISPDQLLPVAQ
ncbi:MAG: helix-turn-helix transcriptional regulator [Anaerolineae bacterium]|nr:helix-turn-helix transcriptional regulator [Anaerolineae bacterium]